MESSAKFNLDELLQISGGELAVETALKPSAGWSVSTDTRCDNHGKLFFALSGENFDAHDFLPQAAESGCEMVCIKKDKLAMLPPGVPALLVDDPLKTLQRLAAYHRQRFAGVKIAGVTGSVGKTSVKEMLRAVFCCACGNDSDQVLFTIGNTNNHIGVPQNLLRLNEKHRFAVIEMGTSSPGEIAPLSEITRPDAAVVNTIAPCHLENLIDLAGVAREKSTIFDGMPDSGTAIIPTESAANELLRQSAQRFKNYTFGIAGADNSGVSAKFINGTLFDSEVNLTFPDGSSHNFTWALSGKHQAVNAAAAATTAYAMGISPEIIVKGLTQTELPGMRMKKTVIDGVTYVNDAYNANPASMLAMLQLLASAPQGEWKQLFLLLGGMRELGKESVAGHTAILRAATELLPAARIITIGREFAGTTGSEVYFADSSEAAAFVTSAVRPGDLVVAKGSRGTRTELALPPEAR